MRHEQRQRLPILTKALLARGQTGLLVDIEAARRAQEYVSFEAWFNGEKIIIVHNKRLAYRYIAEIQGTAMCGYGETFEDSLHDLYLRCKYNGAYARMHRTARDFEDWELEERTAVRRLVEE